MKQLLNQAREKTYKATNTAMVETYWSVSKRILEEEQHGAHCFTSPFPLSLQIQ
ncbi:hypothetical protein KXS16_15660 [Olivibacter jilunii]